MTKAAVFTMKIEPELRAAFMAELPVTLAVRLVSVVDDDTQHAGQAAFATGLAQRAEG